MNKSTPLDSGHEGMNLDNAEGWRPEVGEVIVGTVTDIARAFSEFKEGYYPIVTIEKEDGEQVAIHCFHTVLYNRVVELQPKVGEIIGIKYVSATEKDGKKNKAAVYNVRVKGRSADIWASMPVDARLVPKPQDAAAVTENTEDDIPF